jgi:hypothetical protein
MPRLTRPAAAVAIVIAALLVIGSVMTVLGQPGDVRENTRTTYTLLPEDGLVRVEHRVRLVNERDRGRVRGWGTLRIPSEAQDVQVGSGQEATLVELEGDAVAAIYALEFAPIRPRQRRTITVSYDLTSVPAGFPLTTRVQPDYARFCWAGAGEQQGRVETILPATWTTDTTLSPVKVTTFGDATTLAKPNAAFPGEFYACTDAFASDMVDRIYVLGPSEQLVTVDGWLSDPGWKDAMTSAAATHLVELERILGVPMPSPELRIQEVARVMPLHARGDFRPDDALLYVDEDIDDPGVAAVALARTWFNDATIAEPWLEQGLALWAGLAAADLPCPIAGTAPIEPAPSLSEWFTQAPAPFELERTLLAWQGATACGLIEQVATAIGPEAMTQVTTQLLSASEPASWRDWLLAVEPRLAETDDPDLARAGLLEHGIATAADLADHDTTATPPATDEAFGGSRRYTLLGSADPDDRLLDALADVPDPGAAFGGSRLYALIGSSGPDERLLAAVGEALAAVGEALAAADDAADVEEAPIPPR